MRARRTLLQRPGFAAVSRVDDAAVSADRPALRRIVRRESDRVKMIFRRRGNLSPFLSAVFRRDDDPTRADCKRALAIKNIKAVEGGNQTRVLARPFKSAVRSVENHAISADRPTVALVARESDRADRVALRQRVLPFPSAIEVLRAGTGSGAAEKDGRSERDPGEQRR